MQNVFVKTSNWALFMAAVTAVENRGSSEAAILLLNGEPGSGKTKAVDRFGAERNAVLLEGMPGMSVAFTRDYLAERLTVKETKAFALFNEIVNRLKQNGNPIILDEAQHAVDGKAASLEFLRRVAEQAKVMLILVCHTSETARFSERRLAHINTRITAAPTFRPASIEDCARYVMERCEVGVDEGICRAVHEQSRGRYRLINNAIKSLEAIAAHKGKGGLAADEIAKMCLCEDAMRSLGGK